ncbi:MAG TPA: DNA replication/repair protein RecF [Acidimicrobiales bacterium]|nr:DNA replication/repair protein RecF [Acidimicrobiales bacterium]
MYLASLSISDFRNFAEATIAPDPAGTTVITGRNGAGKTSLLEAIGYLATLQSFRGSAKEGMVRLGADRAILRAVTMVGERSLDIEAELAATGRSRTMVNRQTVRRRSDLGEALRVTVFSPEDIAVVRGGPAERRRFLDETLAVVAPKASQHAEDTEKVLRQRAALLRRAGGRLSPEVEATLDVWDTRLDASGTALVEARETLTQQLTPLAEQHYSRLAGVDVKVGLHYRRSWTGTLRDALLASRADDLVRGITLVGPHRDELELTVSGLVGRTHTSQGEQRSLALAVRLATHQLATDRLGSAPVLLLDDVFSELDPYRTRALLEGLPPGQSILTTALPPPPEVAAAATYEVGPAGTVGAVVAGQEEG